MKEDSSMRDAHREHRYSAKNERMKDQASCGRGRNNIRDDDDDRHIRRRRAGELNMMVTEMQTDTEPDRVPKEIINKEQAAEDIMHSLNKQFTIVADKILPPEKQQSVPGRDTGES